MKSSYSNEFATFWIEDGILHFIYKSAVNIDLAAAEKVAEDRIKFQAGKHYPVFCDAREIKDTEKAARDFLAKEGSLFALAVAFLVAPRVSKVITDFYVRTSKPIIPARLFTDRHDALRFLRQFNKR